MPRGPAWSSRTPILRCRSRPFAARSRASPAAMVGSRRWRGAAIVSSGPVAQLAGRANESAAPFDRKRTNLPQVLTSFIGREKEVAEIKRLLPTTRLLTLTGTGGIGKTRLAIQAASEVLDAYRDGVWFVDLAPLTDPALVPSAVAQVFGVTEAAGRSLTDTLCEYLRGKALLLILDNCEHVLEACNSLSGDLAARDRPCHRDRHQPGAAARRCRAHLSGEHPAAARSEDRRDDHRPFRCRAVVRRPRAATSAALRPAGAARACGGADLRPAGRHCRWRWSWRRRASPCCRRRRSCACSTSASAC